MSGVVAPPRCVGCLAAGLWLCARCTSHYRPLTSSPCIRCQRPWPGGRTCRRCRSATPLAGVVSAGSYGSPALRRGVHWLKFRGIRACAPPLAGLVAQRLSHIAPLPFLKDRACLVPLPLHRRRLRERGFNQSDDLAQELSLSTHISVAHLLLRPKSTFIQTKLPPELRERNVAGAFTALGGYPSPRWFLIVDDVATTGSTLSAAGAALKNTYPEAEIWGVTVARG